MTFFFLNKNKKQTTNNCIALVTRDVSLNCSDLWNPWHAMRWKVIVPTLIPGEGGRDLFNNNLEYYTLILHVCFLSWSTRFFFTSIKHLCSFSATVHHFSHHFLSILCSTWVLKRQFLLFVLLIVIYSTCSECIQSKCIYFFY